ncbi:hypothetical protein GX48_04821 [Paracoccidioides brasiliensis]|nr:hypothetical protein GX48_04821 [Paracoccidioides brasiliensis]
MSTFTKCRTSLYVPQVDQLPLYVENENDLPPYVEQEIEQEDENKVQTFLKGFLKSTDGPEIDPVIVKDLLPDEYQRLSKIILSDAHNFVFVSDLTIDELSFIAVAIVRLLFSSIYLGKNETMSWLLSENLITANTVNLDGMSPLLAAVKIRSTRAIQELIDFGAEPDQYAIAGFYELPTGRAPIKRTPLQLAAALGNLPLVKMFMETYQCDDSKIAPDGELALRLAAENGHRHVVDYLPVRRGGGWKRWRTAHEASMIKAKAALKYIYEFVAFFIYQVPKFFIWTTPKHLFVRPLSKGCKWCWKNRKGLLLWIKHQALQTPVRMKKAAKSMWSGIKRVPKAISSMSKSIWKFLTQFLPKYIWRVCTKEIPKIVVCVSQWIWLVLSSAVKLTSNFFQKVASLLHTAFSAVISFFRNVSLIDIWNGFCDVLRVIFISLPLKICDIIVNFGELTYKIMGGIFGLTGKVLWYIGFSILFLMMYIPTHIWFIIKSIGTSMATAFREIRVWVNPKA